MTWATTLRNAIVSSGQTHYALAKLTGVPCQTIDRIAAGASPNLATAEKLGTALGLTLAAAALPRRGEKARQPVEPAN